MSEESSSAPAQRVVYTLAELYDLASSPLVARPESMILLRPEDLKQPVGIANPPHAQRRQGRSGPWDSSANSPPRLGSHPLVSGGFPAGRRQRTRRPKEAPPAHAFSESSEAGEDASAAWLDPSTDDPTATGLTGFESSVAEFEKWKLRMKADELQRAGFDPSEDQVAGASSLVGEALGAPATAQAEPRESVQVWDGPISLPQEQTGSSRFSTFFNPAEQAKPPAGDQPQPSAKQPEASEAKQPLQQFGRAGYSQGVPSPAIPPGAQHPGAPGFYAGMQLRTDVPPGMRTPHGVATPPAASGQPGHPIGMQGPAGIQVPPGVKGSPGLKGPSSLQGPPGMQAQGMHGLPGMAPPGMQAPQGMQLPPGLQLPPGMQIPPGMQAPPGMQVPPGMQHSMAGMQQAPPGMHQQSSALRQPPGMGQAQYAPPGIIPPGMTGQQGSAQGSVHTGEQYKSGALAGIQTRPAAPDGSAPPPGLAPAPATRKDDDAFFKGLLSRK